MDYSSLAEVLVTSTATAFLTIVLYEIVAALVCARNKSRVCPFMTNVLERILDGAVAGVSTLGKTAEPQGDAEVSGPEEDAVHVVEAPKQNKVSSRRAQKPMFVPARYERPLVESQLRFNTSTVNSLVINFKHCATALKPRDSQCTYNVGPPNIQFQCDIVGQLDDPETYSMIPDSVFDSIYIRSNTRYDMSRDTWTGALGLPFSELVRILKPMGHIFINRVEGLVIKTATVDDIIEASGYELQACQISRFGYSSFHLASAEEAEPENGEFGEDEEAEPENGDDEEAEPENGESGEDEEAEPENGESGEDEPENGEDEEAEEAEPENGEDEEAENEPAASAAAMIED